MVQRVTILGSTGSIGVQTLDVLALHPELYQPYALVAFTRWQALAEQCVRFNPRYAVLRDESAAEALRNHLSAIGSNVEVLGGDAALDQVAADDQTDVVVAAIVGAAGVLPTLAAVNAGKRILLANKEALVVTGQLFIDAVAKSGAQLIPLDSEHNAIFQCLPQHAGAQSLNSSAAGVRKILLTASGGPFRTLDADALRKVTPAQAVRHPNWDMGPKISVDSATLMNKGLELIEASWLFAMPSKQIEVVVHPQSVVHSMVEYEDGSVLAQMGTPDMRTPIACALSWPNRISSGAPKLDFTAMTDLQFELPDLQRFPCLRLAREALEAGGTATAVLNAANEIAVQAFLEERIGFMDIADCVAAALENIHAPDCKTVDEVLEVDAETRRFVAARVNKTD
ncbi:MAG: 1-deoxy-D-xylulose-5-phosphate reductoisomerase [Alcanivoracaceae bacterium]|nr:1-deoxy-D-xylulose-5-phosphate reductoisomerase [Alcanivoracaceae bacterium]